MAKARIKAGGEHGHGLGGVGATTALHGPKGERAGHGATMPSLPHFRKLSSGAFGFFSRSAEGIDEGGGSALFHFFQLVDAKRVHRQLFIEGL